MQTQYAMPHQTDRSQLNVFSTLIFHHAVAFLLLTHSHGGQTQTTGQPQPTLATVGDDVTLQCHVRPAADAVNEMLEWSRPDLNPRFVHVRRSGVDHLVDQNPSYKGRTSVSIDGLKQGDVSLTLSKVRVTDEGTYRCFVPGLKTESNVQLVVVNQTRETHITVPGDFFSGSSGSSSSSSASTIIGLVVGFMFILAVAFVVWKWRQNKIKNKEHHGDEETQRGGDKKSDSIIIDSEQEILIERESDNSKKLTAERETMKNQDKMEEKHHIDSLSEGTGRSCQNEEETHQEKAGGETNNVLTLGKKDRTEGEAGKDLDDTEEETKAINEERQAPRPEKRDTHQEEPEDTNIETAAQDQINKEEMKPAGQAPTDGEKDDLEETGGQKGESDATPFPIEKEGQQNTAEREMMKNSSRSEGTGCSCQNEEETHQEKAGGETRKDLDNPEEDTKSINEETAAPPPAEKDTHHEKPEDTNTETAAQSQMDKEERKPAVKNQMDSDGQQQLLREGGEIKPAGQGLTEGEKDELEKTGGQTGESDATPCPTERGHHANNTDGRDGALSLVDGQTDQLPEVLNGLNKKNEDGKKESTNNEPAGEDARKKETQKDELQPEGEEDNNVMTNETEPPCSLKTETHTEQPEQSHSSRDGENNITSITDNTTLTDKPPAGGKKDVENAEEEKDTENTGPSSEIDGEKNIKQPEKQDGEKDMTSTNDDIRETDKSSAEKKSEEEEKTETEEETEKTGLPRETDGETNGDAQNKTERKKETENQKEKQKVIKKTKKKRSKRSDRNQNVAGGEEEHHPNKGGDDDKYSSGNPDVTKGATDQQQRTEDEEKGDV